jgi:hypothetical protein
MKNDSFKVLSPTAILGYGFPERSFTRGIAKRPDLLAVDAGSTDPGPFYLGAGKSFTSRSAVKRDLELILGSCSEIIHTVYHWHRRGVRRQTTCGLDQGHH